MAHVRCCVPNCLSKYENVGRHYFIFPKECKRYKLWIQNLNLLLPEYEDQSFIIKRRRKVCDLHFEESQFKTSSKMRLNFNAIPSLPSRMSEVRNILESTSYEYNTVSMCETTKTKFKRQKKQFKKIPRHHEK